MRRTALAAVAEQGEANVVFTNCYSSPHDDSTVAALEAEVTSRGGQFIPVFLECSLDELRRRVTDPSRKEMRKLHSVQGLEEFLGTWNLVPLERSNTIVVSTEGRSADECAEEIVKRVL
ncbi:MAG: hypothetical protein ACF8LL_05070 [Phycisphaerales bacterium]